MNLVELTHWRLNYIMDEVSIGALQVLCGTGNGDKPTGLLAKEHLTEQDAKTAGLKLEKD